MLRNAPLNLSRRERQITEILYRLGRATAAEVWKQMPSAPTYTTVRGLLRVLEDKGHIAHDKEGVRYVYYPVAAKTATGKSVLAHVVKTFFAGSPADAVAALLGADHDLDERELQRLSKIVRDAQRKDRQA